MRNIREPRILNPPLQLRAGLRIQSGAGDALDELVAPPVERRAWLELAALCVEAHLEVLAFDPAAWLGVSAEG